MCWSCVHLEFASSGANVFLVLMDSFSNWIKVWVMTSTSTAKTVERQRAAFDAYGFHEVQVSDSGQQFTTVEFADFVSVNGMKQIHTPPYNAASNGAVECTVQTVKRVKLQ